MALSDYAASLGSTIQTKGKKLLKSELRELQSAFTGDGGYAPEEVNGPQNMGQAVRGIYDAYRNVRRTAGVAQATYAAAQAAYAAGAYAGSALVATFGWPAIIIGLIVLAVVVLLLYAENLGSAARADPIGAIYCTNLGTTPERIVECYGEQAAEEMVKGPH